MKKSEPMKKTHASARAPTSWTKPGKGPTKKHSDPTAKPARDPPLRHRVERVPGRVDQGVADH